MPRLYLRLYVAGDGPNSAAARSNLRRLLAALDPSSYDVEIIDCLRDPMRALREGVLVTPMVIRTAPKPAVTVIGSLSDQDRVRAVLGLEHPRAPEVRGGTA